MLQRKLLVDFLRHGDMISDPDSILICKEITSLSKKIDELESFGGSSNVMEHLVELESKICTYHRPSSKKKKEAPYVFSTWSTIR